MSNQSPPIQFSWRMIRAFMALHARVFLSLWIVLASIGLTGPASAAGIVISPPYNYEYIRPVIGLPYSGQFAATGGLGTLHFSATGLPSEMTMSDDGMLTGFVLTPYSSRTFTVTVTDDDGGSASADYTFVTLAIPVVTSMSPVSGPVTGGTQVTVSGYSLENATVEVDGSPVTPSSVGSNTVTFVTPAHAAGAVSVRIIADGSLAGTETFTYAAPPGASDATLSGLTLSSGTLSPSFASGQTNYTVSVPNSVSTMVFTPQANDPNATVDINGFTNLGMSFPLTVGSGLYSINVTAENGVTVKTYTVMVTRAVAPPPLTLAPADGSYFPLNQGTPFSQTFAASGGTAPYTFSVDPSGDPLPDGLALNPATGFVSGTLLEPGEYDVKIKVADSAAQTAVNLYTFNIAAGPVVITGPATLPVGTVGLAYAATIQVVGGTGAKTFTATGLPQGLTMQASGAIDGTPTQAGTYPITVTATDTMSVSDSEDYSLVVNPAFVPTISAITPSQKLVTDNSFVATITGTNLSAVTSVIIGGIWVHLAQIEVVDDTTIKVITPSNLPGVYDVVVNTAGGSDTLTQAFTVNVPSSSDASLAGLALSSGTLSPAFASGTTSYTASVSASVPSITVTPTVNEANATVTVNGTPVNSGTASGPVALNIFGPTAITIVVTAEDGTTISTYTITVSKQIRLIQGIAPASGSILGGTSVVISGTNLGEATMVTFGGVAATSFTVDNDGQITATTPASTAAGAVDVQVLFQGGAFTQMTGGFTYGPVLASDAKLSALTFSAGTIDPAFSPDTSDYVVTVPHDTTQISVTATTAHAGASLSIRDTAVVSGTLFGPIALNVGNNKVGIRVLAEDRQADMPYRVTVVRQDQPGAISLSPASGQALAGGMVGTVYPGATIVATGGTAPYNYAVTAGALPTGLSLNASTGAITGTPTQAGSHGLTVTATDANRVAGSASYTLEVAAAPTVTLSFTPAAGSLAKATAGEPYNQTIEAAGGTAPYGYAVTAGALPKGLSLNASTGAVSGTPTQAGPHGFTVTATDANSVAGSASYTLEVGAAPTVTFTFTPPAGSLAKAMAGEPYSQKIEVTGGTAPRTWSLKSGTLPDGLVLSATTGALAGTISEDAEGDYSFTLEVKDSANATGAVAYTLKVGPREVTVTDKELDVPAGSTPRDVRLDSGATGGPFTSADLTFVQPANAGTATITWGDYAQAGPPSGPVGWYLKFIPDPAYSGTVQVGFRLTSALGVSNAGTVTYRLGHDAGKVAADIDALVHGFVQTRQNLLLTSINVPGLMERRRMGTTPDPVTTRMSPSSDGMTLGFATSLAQVEAARNGTDGIRGANMSPFNVWIDGTLLFHQREQNDDRWGSFGMVSLGADYLLGEKALFGLSFHFDRMSDPTKEDAELTGRGWLAGPYASVEIGKDVFWNTSLLYGGSANDIDTRFWDGTFDTTRWMADTSITGQWKLGETILTPRLRAVYFSEKVDDYTVNNGAGDELTVEGFSEEQFRVSLGAEIARSFTLQNDSVVTPKLGLTGGFSGLDGSGAFGTVAAGVTYQTPDAWMIDASLLFNLAGEGEQSTGAKLGVSKKF